MANGDEMEPGKFFRLRIAYRPVPFFVYFRRVVRMTDRRLQLCKTVRQSSETKVRGRERR